MVMVKNAVSTPQAASALRISGAAWFVAAAVGQVAFVYFLMAFYGARTAGGAIESWNDKPLIDGHIPGDMIGNIMFAVHIALAAVVTLGGLVQLIPEIRRRIPAFHRWNGRVFLTTAIAAAAGGLWLTWVRGTRLSDISAIAISLNAVLILVFAAAAWRLAVARRIDAHRRWAMRAFIAVNGVWFLRIAIMAWIIANQGPAGMNRTLSGPADIMLVFGCYLIPLAVLEIYFQAQKRGSAPLSWSVAALVAVMTGVTALGVFGAISFMWGPHI